VSSVPKLLFIEFALVEWGLKPILPLRGLKARVRSVDNRDIASRRTKKNGRASKIKDGK
jgi:hypothetical protein